MVAMNYSTRKALHNARTAEVKARKRIRKRRAAIHSAMEQAAKMKKSRKKGTSNVDTNMESLGFKRQYVHAPVEEKYVPVA